MHKLVMGFLCLTVMAGIVAILLPPKSPSSPYLPQPLWPIRSVDTMKTSRDLAREKLNDQGFETTIDNQVSAIAATGANYIGLGTPYDPEFIPYLKKWVGAARSHGLKIWFRGNMSGWEKWFGYTQLTAEEHIDGVVNFIKNNPTIFQDGDIFSSCPECENGALGDPRTTGQVTAYRTFLIREHEAVSQAFATISKQVDARYYSMNYDVASLVMNPETTQALGGIVTIDHYVSDPLQVSRDIDQIVASSGGKVFLGEWGAPIPDIHGQMTDQEQAQWIEKALTSLQANRHLIGLNYWTAQGGTTSLWHDDGQAKSGASILAKFYQLKI